jgi:hypothetical protein
LTDALGTQFYWIPKIFSSESVNNPASLIGSQLPRCGWQSKSVSWLVLISRAVSADQLPIRPSPGRAIFLGSPGSLNKALVVWSNEQGNIT